MIDSCHYLVNLENKVNISGYTPLPKIQATRFNPSKTTSSIAVQQPGQDVFHILCGLPESVNVSVFYRQYRLYPRLNLDDTLLNGFALSSRMGFSHCLTLL